MPLSDEMRMLILNGTIVLLIIALIWTMPTQMSSPEPEEEEPDDDPPATSGALLSGEETLLVLLGEYNLDYEPRFRAAASSAVRVCEAFPFITIASCPTPRGELGFVMSNATMTGWIGYAAYEPDEARALMTTISTIRESSDGGYVSIEPGLDRITDYALMSQPDESYVLFHSSGPRYEHAWIARFSGLIIYGYELTNERTISRKFTHAFDSDLRDRVISAYNLSLADYGTR